MSLTISLSWPLLAAIVATAGAWIWPFAHPPEHGGMFPDLSPLFYGGVALIVTLTAWLVYFAARVVWGF